QNQTSKTVVTEAFTFPNECTGELLDVTDTTTIICHDQQRADGTFAEKCQIVQDLTALGRTTGITYHGTGTFKDEFTAADACNFTFTNGGSVHLISSGAEANLVLHFDDIVVTPDCGLEADPHLCPVDW